MKTKELDYKKPFKVNDCEIITRTDYESLPIPMCTKNVSDETMQTIANDIFTILKTNYGENDVIAYFNQDIEDDELKEDIDNDFWREMEEIGIANGIVYYEDIEE